MNDDWIDGTFAGKKLAQHFMSQPLSRRRLREAIGWGDVAVRLRVAEETKHYKRTRHLDLVVSEVWLRRAGNEPSRAQIDPFGDRFSSRILSSMDERKLEGTGLSFGLSGLAAAFPEVFGDPIPDDVSANSRLPDAKLEAWWAALEASGRRSSMTEEELSRHLKATFPDHSVSRDRLREIRGPQKRGPKPT